MEKVIKKHVVSEFEVVMDGYTYYGDVWTDMQKDRNVVYVMAGDDPRVSEYIEQTRADEIFCGTVRTGGEDITTDQIRETISEFFSEDESK